MAAVATIYRSSVGKKVIMAITGIIGYGFVIVHMIGNIKVFEGPGGFDAYGDFLRTVGYPAIPHYGLLWMVRIVLLVAVFLHVLMAVQLTRMDLASRPVQYAQRKSVQASFASLTLRWGGIALFFFIIYHLLHFTVGTVHPDFRYGAPYHNIVTAFQNPFVVIVYLVAAFALAMHLYHGVWSMFQTLGLNNRSINGLWRTVAVVSAIALFVGFSVVPLAVLFGFLTPVTEEAIRKVVS